MQKLATAKHGRFATIEGLTTRVVQFTGCHDVGLSSRRSDEKRVVKLKVKLIKVKKESNDSDYHIVIQSLTNSSKQMVVEIPDPDDTNYNNAQYAALKHMFTDLRATIETLLADNVTGTFKSFPSNTAVTIYGGKVPASLKPVEGKQHVTKFLLGVYNKFYRSQRVEKVFINHQPALLYFINDELTNCQVFSLSNNKIENIYIVRNPEIKIGSKKILNSCHVLNCLFVIILNKIF
ncbi:MAG TPA: hypothetical protein VGI61_13110 [Parafilimonas sp.]